MVNLADPASYSRRGQCSHSMSVPDTLPDAEYCWVMIRVPLKVPNDTVNNPLLRRVKALRLTMVSGTGVPDDSLTTVPIARLRLAGPPWLKRADTPLAGVGGDSAAATAGSVVTASLIGTTDVVYQRPPGIVDEADTKVTQYQSGVTQINESSLRLRAVNVPQYSRAEAFYRFPEGAKSFLGYRELRVWARGGTLTNGTPSHGWGENGELEFFVRIGRDANNFYLYRTTAQVGNSEAAWKDVRVEFGILQALRARIQNAYLRGGSTPKIDCTDPASRALIDRTPRPPLVTVDQVYAACEGGYIAYTVAPGVTPPNLAAVQELSVGMVRVRSGTGPMPIGIASDTLELWVDDIRLRNVVDTPGYAGQIGIDISAGGIADLRIVASKRDAYFRQLAEQPSFVGDGGLDLAGTVRVDRLLPASLGLALPLTITHSGSSARPELLTQSDVTASAIPGLRTPRSSATSYALSARRITPMQNGLIGAILDNVTLNGTWATSDARSEYQTGGAKNWNLGVDYAVAADPRATAMPAWVSRAIGVLPPWMRESELGRAIRGASLRWNPAAIHFTSALARTTDERRTFLKPAASFDDTARVVNGENHVWRNGAGIEFRPAGPLTLRWDATSLRDLRAYDAATRPGRAAQQERARLLGTDVGLERERQMSAAVTLAPPVAVWFHPRLDIGSTFSIVRDPNATTLAYRDPVQALTDSMLGVLPRRFGNTQALNASAQIDLQRAARVYWQTNRLLRALGNALAPIEVSYNRSLLSAFDDEAFSPSLGYQFAFGGAGSMRRIRNQAATSAGLTNTLSANGALALPLDFALVSRLGRTNSRSWSRQTSDRQAVVDGTQVDLPDLTLRWSFVPGTNLLGKLAANLVRSVGTNVGLRNTRVSSIAQFGAVPDARISRIVTYPINATVSWGFGDLSTSLGYAWTVRDDSLPGSATHGTTGERTLDVGRSWGLPASWKTRSPLRTRLSYQEAQTMNVLAESRRRLADNSRNVFSLSADTDVNETMTFSLQGSRTVTVDRNYNRRLTQNVLTAAMQLQFFSGSLK